MGIPEKPKRGWLWSRLGDISLVDWLWSKRDTLTHIVAVVGGAITFLAGVLSDLPVVVIAILPFAGFLSTLAVIDQIQKRRLGKTQLADEPKLIEPAHGSTEAPSLLAKETIERFREVYACCYRPMRYAYEYLLADVVMPLTSFPGKDRFSESEQKVGDLLERKVLPGFAAAEQRFEVALSAATSETDFASLESLFSALCREYQEVVHWVKETGPIVMGDGFFGSREYRELYDRHIKCLEEMVRVRLRGDFGGFLNRIRIQYWENLFDYPSID